MPPLPLLADPSRYRACIQDLLCDGPEVFDYWLTLFEDHGRTLARLPVGGDVLEDHPRWPNFKRDYLAGLAAIRENPRLRGTLTVLELTRYRDEQLRAHGFDDPFHLLKQRENAQALRLLPALLAEIDAAAEHLRLPLIVCGLFAGNRFDMGSRAVVEAFERDSFDFCAARAALAPRPWAIDDLDAWQQRMDAKPYRQAFFFVDNAGADIVLGALPLARELARRSTRVVLAANTGPALNDVTAAELRELLGEWGRCDAFMAECFRQGQVAVVASGCVSPLIDLAQVDAECCREAAGSDLLIIEGMGRAIESNFDARFTVDSVKMALLKDPMVSRIVGASLFDPVLRFEPSQGGAFRNH